MRSLRKKLKDPEFATALSEDMMSSRSFWGDARIRFFKNRMALVSCLILLGIVLFAVFGGFFAQWSNEEVDWSILGNIKTQGMPSLENGHYFGVDELGRDLYARVVQGTGTSLLIGVTAAVFALMAGAFFGSVAGYYGGRLDAFIIGASQITVAIPYIIFFVVWQAYFGRSTPQLILVMVFINWNAGLFVVRGQVLTLKNKEFIDAARLMGQSNFAIIRRHILPNMLGIMIIYASLAIPEIILYESIVSFLGVGIQEPATSWGKLISEGAQTMQFGTLWQFAFPAAFFALAQISLYYIGDGLRDALDPKDR
jgi:oligopeptide transport system permease protein